MKKFAPLLIMLAGILWGTMGLFVRGLNALGIVTMEIVFFRAVITSAFMLVFLLIYNRGLLKIKLKDIWCFLGTGILSIVFFNFCYFRTIEITSMSVAAVLLYTAPAMVMVMSHFLFKERFTLKKLPFLLMTFVGCVLVSGIVGGGATLNGKGILVGLGAGFGYALYSIFSRYALDRGYHTMTITFYTFLFAIVGTLFFVKPMHIVQAFAGEGKQFVILVLLCLLCTVVPYLSYTTGLAYVENGTASVMATVEPVAATVFGMVVYKEQMTLVVLLGMILVLGGIVISGLQNRRRES